MTMVSYAQNGEDVLLARLFPKGLQGFYIDVGAHQPVVGSVTKHFYDQGWHGINVEPAAEPFAALREARPRDVNLCVGLSDKPGTLTFFESGGTGCSTFSPDAADHQRVSGIPFAEREVEMLTLAQVCEDHVEGEIDFLSVDVEGHEGQVLLGADWKRWRPRVVLVEATEPLTTVSSHEAWEPTLLDADYLFATFDGLNRWYVRIEDAKLLEALRTPANILDDYIPYTHFKLQEELRYAARAELQAPDRRPGREPDAGRAVRRPPRRLRGGGAGHEHAAGRVRAAATVAGQQPGPVRGDGRRGRGRPPSSTSRCARPSSSSRPGPRTPTRCSKGVSPESLGVARRLTRLADQHPGAARIVTRPARIAMAVKRRLGGLGAA